MTRLSTGVDVLDRRLRGGFPAGSVVALVAPPEGQSELFLRALCATGPVRYVSTLRPADEVERTLDAAGVAAGVETLRADPQTLGSDPESVVGDAPEDGYLLVDPLNPVERLDREAHTALFDRLERAVTDAGGVAVVHCLDESGLDGRVRTLSRADVVCELHLSRTALSIDNRLYVTKFREGAALTEPVKLILTDAVRVDTSRDIA